MNEKSVMICFEPSNINYFLLKKHIKLNQNIIKCKVKIENYLVGEVNDDSILFYDNLNNSSGVNSVIENNKKLEKTYKKQINLDSYCFRNNLIPDIIKIDVEGYEYNVLKGAVKILKLYRPTIVISIHPLLLKKLTYLKKLF